MLTQSRLQNANKACNLVRPNLLLPPKTPPAAGWP